MSHLYCDFGTVDSNRSESFAWDLKQVSIARGRPANVHTEDRNPDFVIEVQYVQSLWPVGPSVGRRVESWGRKCEQGRPRQKQRPEPIIVVALLSRYAFTAAPFRYIDSYE